MKTIYVFGDSNTYGYDPADFRALRYEACDRWCDRLARETGLTIINGGLNGRTVPGSRREYEVLLSALRPQPDLLLLFLGTNDILMDRTAEDTAGNMEILLASLRRDLPDLQVALLAPPFFRLAAPRPCGAIRTLTVLYEALARKYSLPFLALGDLPLSYDGIHLSQEGHARLAQFLSLWLREVDLP